MTATKLGQLLLIAGTAGALLAGCTPPNPNTAAGRSQIAGEKCEVCIAENPGDYNACHAICVQRVEDEAAYQKAIGR